MISAAESYKAEGFFSYHEQCNGFNHYWELGSKSFMVRIQSSAVSSKLKQK